MLTTSVLLASTALATEPVRVPDALTAPKVHGVDQVPADFPTIQAAIDEGTAPVIVVAPGTYAGATISRPVSLQGHGAVITSGVRQRGASIAFPLEVGASGSEVVGFTIDCTSKRLDMGVYASVQHMGGAPDRVNIADNRFQGCVQSVTNTGSREYECENGRVDGGRGWTVQGNHFDGFTTYTDRGAFVGGIGVYLFNVAGNDVYDNRFYGTVQDTPSFTTGGVIMAGCKDCVVADNDFAVDGTKYHWASVANLGFYQDGAAPSERVSIVGNDASKDSAPRSNFRSIDSFEVDVSENSGDVMVDHRWCGDGRLSRQARLRGAGK
jgi:hypothetical protein